MKQITNKEYEAYQQYQSDRLHGRILTPDGLRVICAGLDNDPEKIGKHMLEMWTLMHRKLSLLQDPFELTTSSLSGHLLARKLGR